MGPYCLIQLFIDRFEFYKPRRSIEWYDHFHGYTPSQYRPILPPSPNIMGSVKKKMMNCVATGRTCVTLRESILSIAKGKPRGGPRSRKG